MTKNNELQNRILDSLIERNLIKQINRGSVSMGPVECNDFSVCFWIDEYYVKIPKVDLYLQEHRWAMPITEQDRIFAKREYESLRILVESWNRNSANVRYIHPVAFIEEYNAIITKREYASLFFNKVRSVGGNSLYRKDREELLARFNDLARALAGFHGIWAKPVSYECRDIVKKIGRYGEELISKGVKRRYLEGVLKSMEALAIKTYNAEMTKTLKGFDIRNIFIGKAGDLILMDPGGIKYDCREADLARYLVTLKILYWGTPYFAFNIVPDALYFETFIRSYYSGISQNKELLSLFTIKELFKQWKMAYNAVRVKDWPVAFKKFISRYYIDSFYMNQVKSEVATLE